jgi:hypothetical protein
MKFGFVFRALLGLTLIILGLKGITEVHPNKTKIVDTITRLEKEVLAPLKLNINLELIKKHSTEIVYFQNLSLIYGGFLLFFGMCLSKAFITVFILLEIILINNLYFNRDEKSIKFASVLLSILGGILTI